MTEIGETEIVARSRIAARAADAKKAHDIVVLDVSEQLVIETLKGSVAYYEMANQKGDAHVAALRNQVTSPGGTTAAALSVLMAQDGLDPLMTKAVAAAAKRGRELAG